MLKTIGIAAARLNILPVDPVTASSFAESICIKNATIPILAVISIVYIIT